MSKKITIPDSIPKYRCPKCGSYNILSKSYYITTFSKIDDTYYFETTDRDIVEDEDECECMECDNVGIIGDWKEKDNG